MFGHGSPRRPDPNPCVGVESVPLSVKELPHRKRLCVAKASTEALCHTVDSIPRGRRWLCLCPLSDSRSGRRGRRTLRATHIPQVLLLMMGSPGWGLDCRRVILMISISLILPRYALRRGLRR